MLIGASPNKLDNSCQRRPENLHRSQTDQLLKAWFQRIGGWTIDPLSICDELVSYFESHAEKQTKGESDAGKNLDIKNSIPLL